jgi:glutaredoxin 3
LKKKSEGRPAVPTADHRCRAREIGARGSDAATSKYLEMTMPEITLYTKPTCPYCLAAKALLRGKGVAYREIDIENNRAKTLEMIERSGRRTVPQIYVGGTHVGGYDDLRALENEGGLDALLTPTV